MLSRADEFLDLKEHENIHFDNAQDIHMSSENYEENGYEHDLDMLIISHQLRVSYPTRRENCPFKAHLAYDTMCRPWTCAISVELRSQSASYLIFLPFTAPYQVCLHVHAQESRSFHTCKC